MLNVLSRIQRPNLVKLYEFLIGIIEIDFYFPTELGVVLMFRSRMLFEKQDHELDSDVEIEEQKTGDL